MQTTFVFIFYIILNLVPANVDKFQVEGQEPGKDEKVTLYFERQAKEWKVIANTGKKESVFLRLDGKDFYLKEENKNPQKVDLLNKMNIETNHKKWGKVTKVIFEAKEKTSPDNEEHRLIFNIKKDGKKKRIIDFDRKDNPEYGKYMPVLYMSWK